MSDSGDRAAPPQAGGARPADAAPLVSVIVPVRNNTAGVREVIRRLEAQTLPRNRFEIVIGDDGSQVGALDGVATSDGWVRVAAGPPRNSYAARNRAARCARGAVLAFCDSDCLPQPQWLEAGLQALERADIVAGEVTYFAPARPSVWSLLTIDMYLDQQRNVRLARAVTANLFVKRRVFEARGGFDDTLPSSSDFEFVSRAVAHGARLAYAARAAVLHPTLDDCRAYLAKVWMTNRWAAARRARDGNRPNLGTLLTFMPVVGVMRARRHAFRPVLRLTQPRLEAAGLRVRWSDEALALCALYTVVAQVAGLARLRGWFDGKRMAREWAAAQRPASAVK